MSYTYKTHGTCSRQIIDGGINCNGKGTSCPDQLAKAIDEVL